MTGFAFGLLVGLVAGIVVGVVLRSEAYRIHRARRARNEADDELVLKALQDHTGLQLGDVVRLVPGIGMGRIEQSLARLESHHPPLILVDGTDPAVQGNLYYYVGDTDELEDMAAGVEDDAQL